ncbi:MAG TPA: type II secretion system F family protein [Nitrospirota bacterium]|nr:type II secretion system F family protein [Nitrospirota bacterium]
MPLFTYKAVREDGTSFVDEAMATDAVELRQELEGRGYLVLSLDKKRAALLGGRSSAKEFLLFNQEFSTLVKAGLPILQALEILQKRTEKPAFRAALESIIQDIKGGTALSDAMAKHPTYFSPLYTATVRAGEKSGALVDVLMRFITYQKKMIAVMTKLKMSLAYPIFLVLALIVVLGIFFIYVIPNFTEMYSDQAGSLPFLTSLLIEFTRFLTRFTPFLLAGIVAAGVALYSWQKTVAGRNTLDSIKLKIPLIRLLITQYLLAQITRTLATVLRGGIPLVQALDTTAGVINNRAMSRRLSGARVLVTEGVSLAASFERTRVAPDITVRMIEVGESSGDLPLMLEDVADYYDQEVENRLTALTTLIEPVLMLTMGLIMAVIVVALYLPIFEMGAHVK